MNRFTETPRETTQRREPREVRITMPRLPGRGRAGGIVAAIGAIATMLKSGDHVVVSDNTYGGTFRLFDKVLTRYKLSFSYVDTSRLEDVERAQPSVVLQATVNGEDARQIDVELDGLPLRRRAPVDLGQHVIKETHRVASHPGRHPNE